MGRSYFVAESVQKYLEGIVQKKNNFITGLLVGQCSAQRDYVVLAAQTPPKEAQHGGAEDGGESRLSDMDEEWFCIHAAQISRMLPGGLLLVGVFLISPPEVSKEAPNALRKLIFAAERTVMRSRLWAGEGEISERVALHICSSTNKIVCRTFDVQDPKSSARPADWKYQSPPVSWVTIECNVGVTLTVSLPKPATYQEQQRSTRARLARWAQEVEGCTILLNGRVRDDDEDLLEDQRKGRSANSRPVISASFLTSANIPERCTARLQSSDSSLRIEGVVRCRGYLGNNRPKVREAAQVIRRDLLSTVSDRCDIIFQDLLLNTSHNECDWSPCPLPQRVFVPLPGDGPALCDYIIRGETEDEVQDRLLETLGQEVTFGDLEFGEISVEEKQIVCPSNDEKRPAMESHPHPHPSSSVTPQAVGLMLAAAGALLAVLFYLLQ